MKKHSAFLAALALWGGTAFLHAAPPAVADRPVVWSVRFDAERLRSGAGQGLFARLDPILTNLSGDKSGTPGGKLESVAVYGFQPKSERERDLAFLADFRFTTEGGGIAQRFQAVSRKHDAPVEDLAGFPTIHFKHEGKEVWIAKLNDARVYVSGARKLLEGALALGADGLSAAAPARPDEVFGGNVEIEDLMAYTPNLRDSELFKLLPRAEFHVLSADGSLDLDASAQLDSERSARRASRMIDGMVAATALHDRSGVPWDERLSLQQNGANLSVKLHLEPQEARKLFDTLTREMANHAKAAHDNRDDE